MAWIYFQASAGLPWRSVPGPDQSAIVKTTDTHRPFLCHGCGMEVFPDVQYGTTCEHCAGTLSVELLKSSMADFPARTLVLQDAEQAWQASEADFSSTSPGLSAKQTRDLYFSKTSQQLELVASMVSSKHLPSSGMIVGGRLYQPPKLAPRTCGKDGFSWPTPIADDAIRSQSKATADKRMARYKKAGRTTGGTRQLASEVLLWPTPRASDADKGIRTPAGAAKERLHRKNGQDLPTMVGGGQLNPTWVEWLMGYHPEWTVCADWGMQWSRSKPKQRLKD